MGAPGTIPIEWWRRPPPSARVDAGRGETRTEAPGARVAFVSLVLFTIIMVAAPQQFIPIIGKLRIALLTGGIAIVAHLSGGLRRRDLAMPIEVRLTVALFALGLATVPFALWPGGAFQTLTDLYLKSIIIFWLLGRVIDTEAKLRTLMRTLAVLILPIALTAVRHYLAGDFSGGRVVAYGGSLASNPNDLALTMALFLPSTLVLALSAASRLERTFCWATAAMGAAAIVLTFSRGGFLALAVEGVLLLALMFRRGSAGIAAGIVGALLLALAMVPGGYYTRLSTIVNIDADPTASAQARWRDMTVAADWVIHHPLFGVGPGNDILKMNQLRGADWLTVHDTYLNYAMDLGVPGLLLFLALLVMSLRSARRVARAARADGCESLALLADAVAISLIGFAVAGLVYPLAYHFSFYYMAGLAVALKTIAARSHIGRFARS